MAQGLATRSGSRIGLEMGTDKQDGSTVNRRTLAGLWLSKSDSKMTDSYAAVLYRIMEYNMDTQEIGERVEQSEPLYPANDRHLQVLFDAMWPLYKAMIEAIESKGETVNDTV